MRRVIVCVRWVPRLRGSTMAVTEAPWRKFRAPPALYRFQSCIAPCAFLHLILNTIVTCTHSHAFSHILTPSSPELDIKTGCNDD